MRTSYRGRASRGSQLHLQDLVNANPEYLNGLLLSNCPSLRAYAIEHPRWTSPLKAYDYCECRDRRFLEAIGHPQIADRLHDFWPRGGPVWDALATVQGVKGGHGAVLVEAKSHATETGNRGYRCRATRKSLEHISASLEVVKRDLGVGPGANWLGEHYQYANRIAHLWLLNSLEIPAWMVFVYFVGDIEQNGPSAVAEWLPVIDKVNGVLNLPHHHRLEDRIVSVFVPVTEFRGHHT